MLYGARERVLRTVLDERWNKDLVVTCFVGILEYFSEEKSGLEKLENILHPGSIIAQHGSGILY